MSQANHALSRPIWVIIGLLLLLLLEACSSLLCASGLEVPWSPVVLTDGGMLLTERTGRVRVDLM